MIIKGGLIDMSEYSLLDHRHRYAMWTSCRAVQRNFLKSRYIVEAIESAQLKEFVEFRLKNISSFEEYDNIHVLLCENIIKILSKYHGESSYGRAAKVLAIYLKTSIGFDKDYLEVINFVHPPIDRIPLQNFAKKVRTENKDLYKFLKEILWTKMDKSEYFKLVNEIRSHLGKFNWELEEFWDIE